MSSSGRLVLKQGILKSPIISFILGLNPSWYVQHVVVWDTQTDHMFFFVLEDWLSVENHKNETVEKEVLASCKYVLKSSKNTKCFIPGTQMCLCLLNRSWGDDWVPQGLQLPAHVRGEGAPPLGVPVGASGPQLFYQGSKGHLQCSGATPVPGSGGSVVWGCGLWRRQVRGFVGMKVNVNCTKCVKWVVFEWFFTYLNSDFSLTKINNVTFRTYFYYFCVISRKVNYNSNTVQNIRIRVYEYTWNKVIISQSDRTNVFNSFSHQWTSVSEDAAECWDHGPGRECGSPGVPSTVFALFPV